MRIARGTSCKSTKLYLAKRNPDRENPNALLYNIELFKGIKPSVRKWFFGVMERRSYPGGTVINIPEEASSELLHILISGHIIIYLLTPSGKKLLNLQYSSGSVFGWMGVLGLTMYGNFAEATEDSVTLTATREQVMTLLKRSPDFSLRVLEILSERVHMLEERLAEVAYTTVKERLASFLLTNADGEGMIPDITHEQIGNAIGAVRQTVTENLNLMKKQGLIATKERHIQIVNRLGLENVSAKS